MKLCLNCLETYKLVGDIKVQKTSNTYRGTDHYTKTVQLCKACADAFEDGDFKTLHDRYSDERTVRRDG